MTPAELAALSAPQAASYWFVRRDADEMSDADASAFEAWLMVSELNRDAYDRAKAVWRKFDLPAASFELSSLRAAALADLPKSTRRLQIAAALVAACAILAVTLGFKERLMTFIAASRPPPPPVERFRTARNERTAVTLADGTVVALNIDSDMTVSYSENERRVTMIRGEAFFQVAKNSRRPFLVDASDRRITAMGTQFDVRLDPARVEVVLLEGAVAVDSLTLRRQHFELRPGQHCVAVTGEPPAIAQADAQRLTSWRQGLLVFEDETLAEAVNELNRYSSQPILVPDEAVRQLRLSGVFRIGEPQRFAAVIQELLPVRVVQDPQGGTLLLPATAREKLQQKP